MQIIKGKTNFDFIGKRKIALFISSVLNIGVIVGIAIFGFNFGVDFVGGTLVEVKFAAATTAEQVREGAVKGGLQEPQVQGIGSADDNNFILRMGGVTQLTAENEQAAEAAVRGLGEVVSLTKNLDTGIINVRFKTPMDPESIKAAVVASGTGVTEVTKLGEADYQIKAEGMAAKVTSALKTGLNGADFEVRRTDYVGPQVGKQLRNKGIMALLWAMLFILIYVAFRFDLKFGPGALVGMLHDVMMVAGYFLITRREFNLTSIAVLLTVIGYSINDTIVVYDRIREEMIKYKGKPLPEIINIAVNDTLARTILTSGVTALSLIGLLVYGVGEIFDFAAAMLIGIVAGTYSSVYIASPMVIWLDEREHEKEASGGGTPMKAKPA
ncbi:MAG: protein translocase subunit SecF [Archangium sp.]|nr:protein translocase subunit SecF [Archangium sp.]MDP3151677.1 protein translocase subunit SecF [Archangium sp.]MDP3573195.1 protein translocase subunit SecF [Archangium sp.]